jgi:uncharacterized caspase-like protein
MNADDYAILVGIARYPELGEGGTALDLKGSTNDVDAVSAWLEDPNGGGLLRANIKAVPSNAAAARAADATPSINELEAALANLDDIAQTNKRAGKGQRVGRRLYIYMSGHGFSPARERGCLYAANAQERLGHNVHASGWLAWLQDAGYFREFVLWMDCCMNRVSFLPPRDPPLPPVNVPAPPGPTFVAFAAQRPLKAVETAIAEDGGKHHGVFTWALLEGLRGAAADSNGRVTGRSLADWIRNAQAGRMGERDRKDPDVSKEPEVVREDPALIFARGVPPRTYTVNLYFSDGEVGKEARIWGDAPPRVEAQFNIAGRQHSVTLRPGLHLIDVPASGLRQGFEVVGPTTLDIREPGGPVQPSADTTRMFALNVDAGDPAAEIYVVDHRFSLVDGNPGRLGTPLPFGLFKIKTRLNRKIKERVILLDQDLPQLQASEIVEPLATAAPLDGTAATHEYHVDAARRATEAAYLLGRSGHRAALTVMVRVWSPQGEFSHVEPWKGITVVDAKGKEMLNFGQDGEHHRQGDPFAVITRNVEPGTYFLRQELDATESGTRPLVLEQSLVVPDRWGVEIYLMRRAAAEGDRLLPRPRLSILMRQISAGIPLAEEQEDRLIETARQALADERRVLSAELEELLMRKYQDPIAGILGAHLLLIEADRDPTRGLEMLDEVVPKLRDLVGPDHPDVEAISLRCPNPKLRRTKRIAAPPIFQRSWRLLAEGSLSQAALVPRSLWQRVQAAGSLPPFLVWVVDDEVRAAFRRNLAVATWGLPRAAPAAQPAGSPAPAAAEAAFSPARDFIPVRAASASRKKTAARHETPMVDVKTARERARKLQVPASALGALAKELGT